MSNFSLQGLGVALITPFNEDKNIDFDALARIIEYQVNSPVDYIVALGTTAETPVLWEEEHHALARFIVKEVAERKPLVIGIGGNDTRELVQKLKTFDLSGFSAILSVTPYYNKPTQEGLFLHYKALSEVAPLPIILYNVPGRSGVNMLPETSLRIARESKNVIAIKEACGDIEQIKEIIKHAPDGFSVLSGDDNLAVATIEAGGVGVISVLGNAFPKKLSEIIHTALKGSINSAQKMNEQFTKLNKLIFVEGNPGGIKCILNEMNFIGNDLRLPLVPVSNATRKKIQQQIQHVK